MGDRKQPRGRPLGQLKPDPPPAPPRRRVGARVTIQAARCEVFSTEGMRCPLCQSDVPPDTRHECEKTGGIIVRRNRAQTR